MKKLFFTGVLCFVVSLSFAQKKAISSAKNEIKGNTPNIAEARSIIKGALANAETANDAEAWFVAGQIENKQFDVERTKEILGKKPEEAVMYEALGGIIPYFEKAFELDQLPDAKGKVKPKYTKDIKAIIRANRPFYVNAGIFYYDQKDYQKAYENFKQYGDIPELDIFKDEKWEIVPTDSSEVQFKYYAGLAASMVPNHEAAIDIFSEIRNLGYNENEIYQRLCYEYNQVNDSVSFLNTIKEGFTKFPGEQYYVLNLINLTISSGKSQEAVNYLQTAIEQDPKNAQLYDVLGQVYEQDKDYDNAINYLKKSLEIDPEYIDALTHIGRVYFNRGVETRGNADSLSDLVKSKEESQKALNYFKEALPYFEKAFSAKPQDRDIIYALRSIYYNLSMGEQFDKMDALYNEQLKSD
jgi:tetratricopeptide (TPR) repeat protein